MKVAGRLAVVAHTYGDCQPLNDEALALSILAIG